MLCPNEVTLFAEHAKSNIFIVLFMKLCKQAIYRFSLGNENNKPHTYIHAHKRNKFFMVQVVIL